MSLQWHLLRPYDSASSKEERWSQLGEEEGGPSYVRSQRKPYLTLKLLNHSDESQPSDPVIVHKQQSPVLQFILGERS